MMPSSVKQQTPSSSGGVVTTTVTTTTTAPSAKFTQAELGARSLARSIDRKMNEMNQQKTGSNDVLNRVLARETKNVSEDVSFGSTSVIAEIPERIIRIVESNGIPAQEIIRMIHMPGATVFSVSHNVGGVKKYSTFRVDEIIDEPEPEPEVEIQEDSISDSNDRETFSDDADLPEVPLMQGEPVLGTNTLGTVGVAQKNEPEVINETIAPVAVLPEKELPTEVITPAIVESVKQETVDPIIDIRANLDKSRMATARELVPYYSSRYKERPTGTFNQLFGNNQSINDSLFKTINDYENAKKIYFREIAKSNLKLTEVISLVREEQLKVSDVLSHEKHGLFSKIASKFHITIPSVIETRNRIIGSTITIPKNPLSERLGIHQIIINEPIWKKLFSTTNKDNRSVLNPSTEIIPQKMSTASEQIPETTIIEKKNNTAKLYHLVYPFILKAFNIAQKNNITTESVHTENISEVVNTVTESTTVQPVVPIETDDSSSNKPDPVVVINPPSFSSNGKQHPEHLFNR